MKPKNVLYTTAEDLQRELSATVEVSEDTLLARGQRSKDRDVVFFDADDLTQASKPSVPASAVPQLYLPFVDRPGGYPRRGPGRKKGPGLDVRNSLLQVLVVLLSTSAYLNRTELIDATELRDVSVQALCDMRQKLRRFTDKALSTRAWELSRSGPVGVMVKYGTCGSREDRGRHLAVAVEASFTGESVV